MEPTSNMDQNKRIKRNIEHLAYASSVGRRVSSLKWGSVSTNDMSWYKKATDFLFSKESLKYVCSTHFWGPVSNFGIPFAAIVDLKKDPDLVSPSMTSALIVYSLVFMRYATQVRPWNPLLFGCHFVNEGAQLGQGYRYLKYVGFTQEDNSDGASPTQNK